MQMLPSPLKKKNKIAHLHRFCRVHSDDSGLDIVLKGGQMGPLRFCRRLVVLRLRADCAMGRLTGVS
jgi:hypothetical protein